MARKNLLESVLTPSDDKSAATSSRSEYALKGASGKMKASLDTLAENSKRLLEGETIVEIEPDLIDGSFVNDRLSVDNEDFNDLKATIERDGQDTPVLLRPHPSIDGRYMVVFGHRRVKAAGELNRPVRSIIKKMDDIGHILAQGQENSARSDLSFIEKALFAKRLLDLGHSKELIQSALTIDATLLSRMLSVSQKISEEIIEAIGPAKNIGRDRWEAFKKLVVLPPNRKKAMDCISRPDFDGLSSDKRFETLLNTLQSAKSRDNKAISKGTKSIELEDIGNFKIEKNVVKISLSKLHAAAFSKFIEADLENIIARYKSKSKG